MVFAAVNIFRDILGIVFALLAVAVAYWKWSFTYWKRKGVVHSPPSIPFGNVPNILRQSTSFGETARDIYEKYKKDGLRYYGFYFLTEPILVFTDLDLIKRILAKDFEHFTDHANYNNEKVEPLKGHLFDLKGLKWKNLRAKLTPTFSSGKMKMMFRTLVDCTHGLVEVVDEVVKNENVLDIKDTVGRYTTDVIGSCAFGLNCNSLKNPDSVFRTYGKNILKFGRKQTIFAILSFTFPKVVDTLGLTFFNKEISAFFTNIVKQMVEYREKNNVVRKDFMHLLIQLKNNVDIKNDEQHGQIKEEENETENIGKKLTLNEIAAQVFIFFLAGFETSSTTLTFCLYELSINSKIQNKLREEVNETLEKHNGEITYEAITEMHYMEKCIEETLRKYPPLPVLTRECTKAYHIPDSDLVIDKKTRVFIPVLGIHYDPEYYPEPEVFDPERFSSENKAKRHPFAWLSFGEGPRTCIGLRFGLMQTKVALAVLLKNYKFTLNPKTMTPIVLNFSNGVISAKGEVWLNVQKVDDEVMA